MAYHFTEEQVREAAENSATYADVAKCLQCSWHTAVKFCDKYSLKDVVENNGEKIGELARDTIYSMIRHAAGDYDYAKGIQSTLIYVTKAKLGWRESSVLIHDTESPFDKLLQALDDKAGTETEPE